MGSDAYRPSGKIRRAAWSGSCASAPPSVLPTSDRFHASGSPAPNFASQQRC